MRDGQTASCVDDISAPGECNELSVQEWTDDRLAWQPERFGNLTDIILKADKIWLPELAIMNGLAHEQW